MKVLFLTASADDIVMRTLPLGLVAVASAVRHEGHEVRVLSVAADEVGRGAVEREIESFQPGCVCVAVRNIDDQAMRDTRFLLKETREIVKRCRTASRVPVLVGGAGYSIYPVSALSYLGADAGIRGEGERALPAVLRCVAEGGDVTALSNVFVPGGGVRTEDSGFADSGRLPAVDPDLWPCAAHERGEVWMPFQTRRGCALGCSYCSTARIEGTTYRCRTPEAAIENITRHVDSGFRNFYCTDNTFNLPEKYAEQFCHRLAEAGIDISWMAIVYPCAVSGHLVNAMARSGCTEISLGFESGCDSVLRMMNKRYGVNDVRRTAAIFADNGIRMMGFLLLGGPGETRASALESLAFADSLPLAKLSITIGVRIYPQTPLASLAVKQGVVAAGDDLLMPRFYIARDLSGWLYETVAEWALSRPHWQL